MKKDLIKFDFDVAVIAALDAKYKDIQKITDGKSKDLVMEGLAEYRELRLKIDIMHKELKADILEAGRGLDGDKNRLKCLLEPGESYLKGIRKVWDDEKDRIKEEKETKEKERILAIQEKINSIRILGLMQGKTSSMIKERLILTTGIEISEDIYREFMDPAIEAHKATIAELEKLLNDRLQFEKEEVERKAETERLEAQRKEQEAAQAKIDEANRKIEEKKQSLEREEFEHQAAIRAEQKAKEDLERMERERIEKEKAEAKEKEQKAALKPDKEKLINFADNLIDMEMPRLSSAAANKILTQTIREIDILATDIIEQAKKL